MRPIEIFALHTCRRYISFDSMVVYSYLICEFSTPQISASFHRRARLRFPNRRQAISNSRVSERWRIVYASGTRGNFP